MIWVEFIMPVLEMRKLRLSVSINKCLLVWAKFIYIICLQWYKHVTAKLRIRTKHLVIYICFFSGSQLNDFRQAVSYVMFNIYEGGAKKNPLIGMYLHIPL